MLCKLQFFWNMRNITLRCSFGFCRSGSDLIRHPLPDLVEFSREGFGYFYWFEGIWPTGHCIRSAIRNATDRTLRRCHVMYVRSGKSSGGDSAVVSTPLFSQFVASQIREHNFGAIVKTSCNFVPTRFRVLMIKLTYQKLHLFCFVIGFCNRVE